MHWQIYTHITSKCLFLLYLCYGSFSECTLTLLYGWLIVYSFCMTLEWWISFIILIIESLASLQQEDHKLLFRSFSLMRALPSIGLVLAENELEVSLSMPLIHIDMFLSPVPFNKEKIHSGLKILFKLFPYHSNLFYDISSLLLISSFVCVLHDGLVIRSLHWHFLYLT